VAIKTLVLPLVKILTELPAPVVRRVAMSTPVHRQENH
jgi:hypothetical protein